jgi:hypothetical protein
MVVTKKRGGLIPLHYNHAMNKTKKLNSVVLVRERTILAERPPIVSEVNANLCG